MILLQGGPIPPEGAVPPEQLRLLRSQISLRDPMILVTTSRKANPLVRRIGRNIAFAAGGTYHSRGKGGLSRPPFSDGPVLVLSREAGGIRMQLIDRMEEGPSFLFPSVKEEARPGPLRRGIFTGDPALLSSLCAFLPLEGDADLPGGLVFDGIQGRRITLGEAP